MPEAATTPRVNITEFRTPEFWNRSVLFFANLKSLFLGNTEQTEELAQLVGEIDTYGGRLAPVLNLIYRSEHNTLFLERSPEQSLMAYFSRTLGLGIPKIELLAYDNYQSHDKASEQLAKRTLSKSDWVDGYVTDSTLLKWADATNAQTVSSAEGCRTGNNKTSLYQFLAAENLPTPDTVLADSPNAVIAGFRHLHSLGYRNAVARAAIGASGIGMIKTSLDDLSQITVPSQFFHGGPCLVQGWLEPGIKETHSVSSPSVQLFIDDHTAHLFDITDQILSSDSVHEGNYSPPLSADSDTQAELLRQASEAAIWLYRQGYRGTASVDFLVVEKSNKPAPEAYICEINARITGATYPSVLARNLQPGSAWLMRNLRLEHPINGKDLLSLIDQSNHLYRREQREGIVPLNFNCDPRGQTRKGQFLCLASDVPNCARLLDSLVSSLPFKTQIERD